MNTLEILASLATMSAIQQWKEVDRQRDIQGNHIRGFFFFFKMHTQVSKAEALICMLRFVYKLLPDWADFQNVSRKVLAQQHVCKTFTDSVKSLETDSEKLRAVAAHPVNPE